MIWVGFWLNEYSFATCFKLHFIVKLYIIYLGEIFSDISFPLSSLSRFLTSLPFWSWHHHPPQNLPPISAIQVNSVGLLKLNTIPMRTMDLPNNAFQTNQEKAYSYFSFKSSAMCFCKSSSSALDGNLILCLGPLHKLLELLVCPMIESHH